MMIEPRPFAAPEDRATVALRRGREIAERVRSGATCTDREYRFLAALYELSANAPTEASRGLLAC